MLSSTRRNRVA